MNSPTPLDAYDVWPNGTARPAEGRTARAPDGAAYRWLHFDLDAAGLAEWVEANLPANGGSALLQPETRPRCDALDPGLILNVRGVNLNPGQSAEDMVSLRIWMQPDLVVSVRKRRIFAVDDVRTQLAHGRGPASPAAWVDQVVEGLTRRIESAILALEDETDALEQEFLDDVPSADSLGPLRRKLIKLQRFLAPQREALARLVVVDDLVAAERASLRESANRAARALETLVALNERAKSMQDQVHMANAERMNRNGMILSIVASIFLPLGFLTGLFGVNLAGIPAAANPAAFGALVAVCAMIGVALYATFRRMRWF